MARTVEHAKLETPTARARLKRGRQAHLQSLVLGKAALAYQRKPGTAGGRWLLRRHHGGRYTVEPLGLADDLGGPVADGIGVLAYEQARSKALDLLAQTFGGRSAGPLTVRRAMSRYVDY